MAYANPLITADAVDAQEFMDLSRRYRISGVPKTIVNETIEIMGGLPEADFVDAVLQPADEPRRSSRCSRERNVELENLGSGANLWTPMTSSIIRRTNRLCSPQLASGEKRTPIRPTRSVWPRSQSRSLGLWFAFSSALERLFISAIFTSAGQAVVHIPQPEQ